MIKARNLRLMILLSFIIVMLLSMTVLAGTVFKVATNHSGLTPATKGLYYFNDRISELTNGEIKLKIYEGAVLGDEVEEIEQCLAGTIEMTRVCTGHLCNFTPMLDIFSVPYLFKNKEQYLKVINGQIGRELAATCENSGYKLLVWVDGGSRSFYNNVRPINTPEDLKGLKIRVMSSDVMLQSIKALGASPTTTSYSEVYSALQTGVIDGAENSPICVDDMKHYEVCKYYSLDEHMMIPDTIIINLDAWNSLTSIQKAAFLQVSEETQKYIQKEWTIREKISLDAIKESGTAVNAITDENKKLFIEKVEFLQEKLDKTFSGYIERIKSLTDK